MATPYLTYEGLNEAITPIFHGGDEKTGSSPILRTIMVLTDEGEVAIPYIHGNAIRGKLRRIVMKDFLDIVGFSDKLTNKKLYHALFSGGVLETTKSDYGVIDLSLRKEVVELCPPVSLFGCAFGNQLIQGKLVVGHMFPVCKEYAKYLPDWIEDKRLEMPFRVFTDSSFITRRDDLREEREENEQAVQMKIDYECFIPGTLFYHEFRLLYVNDIEVSCFGEMIELWKGNPVIGGRSASGDGKLSLDYKFVDNIDVFDYLRFLEKNKSSVVKLLEELNAKL